MRRLIALCVPLLGVLLVPSAACANAGTPLIWASALHLLFGNLMLGTIEGVMIARLFKRDTGPCVALLIVGNYFSAWVGGVFFVSWIEGFLSLDLYNAWRWLWGMVAITYLVTLVLEWPFVVLCLCRAEGWFRKSLWGSLVVQSTTYLALCGGFWLLSGTTLYTQMTIVPPAEMSLPADIVLYFISESDGNVYALDTCQREPRKVADLNSTQRQDRLYLAEVQADTGRCELMANVEVHDADGWTWKDVPTGITCPAATLSRDGEETSYEVTNGIGEVPRLGPSAESGWRFRCGFWPFEGLYGENHKTGRTSDVSLETPFVAWYVRYATQIPGGQVVFQLSDRRSCQICLLDPEEKKITLLAKGRGPAVAWRESEGERPLPNGTPNPDSEAQNQMEAKAMPEKAAAK